MEKHWADIITYWSMYSVLIPFSIACFRFKKLNNLQRLIFGLVGLTLTGEFGVTLLAYVLENNLPAVHLFTVLQFVLLMLIMERGVVPVFSKYTFKILIIVFIIFAMMDAFLWNGLYSFNSYSRPFASLLLLFPALAFFYKTLKELKVKSLEKEPLLWISIGVLIYFSSNLFIFLFTNYVKTSNEALLTLWGVHAIFNIILNVFYSIALWIKPVN